jgi:nitrate/TMAO reductase-like tetraheme cytochrome c subunit
VYKGKLTTCVSCHQTDFSGAKAPDHVQSQFPTDCTPCHTTTAWTPASFNHSATLFPLTGAHQTAVCSDCHADGVYKGKPTTCQSCHLQDFTATTSPNHRQLGWPQTCTTCHAGSGNTTAWDLGVTLPSQYHNMFSVTHEKARGVCTECHNTTNYAQSTCSNHHHPPTCTYLNQSTCRN